MYTATYLIVASSGTYVGNAINKSPKKAFKDALANCWSNLYIGDSKARIVSGIAVEQWAMARNNKLIGSYVSM
jgi:hypothetical protein